MILLSAAMNMLSLLNKDMSKQKQLQCLQIMEIDICCKKLLNQVIKKLELPKCIYGYEIVKRRTYRSYVKVKITDGEEETKEFWGTLSSKRTESEQVAARKAIKYLRSKYEFEVNDINYGDMQYNEWRFNRVDKAYHETMNENKELKKKIAKYEKILNKEIETDGDEAEPIETEDENDE